MASASASASEYESLLSGYEGGFEEQKAAFAFWTAAAPPQEPPADSDFWTAAAPPQEPPAEERHQYIPVVDNLLKSIGKACDLIDAMENGEIKLTHILELLLLLGNLEENHVDAINMSIYSGEEIICETLTRALLILLLAKIELSPWMEQVKSELLQ
jgi:hypothetical protein